MLDVSNKLQLISISSFIVILVCSVILLSSPGWDGEFWFDDFPNIVNNSAIQIQSLDYVSLLKSTSPTASGSGMTRPVSYITFAINYYFSGTDPYYFKLTNTMLHAINAMLFFFLSIRLIQLIKKSAGIQENHILWLAFSISIFWAISPMNVTSSLYVVQRMNELSAMFVVIGCLFYLHIRTIDNQTILIQILYLLVFLFILTLATLSKENGVLLVPLCLCVEFLIRKSKKTADSNILFFYLFFVLLFILPLCYILSRYYNYIININQPSSFRDFSALERLFTQFRIVLIYTKQIFFPDIYQLSLLHDGYGKSTSLFEPITTFFSLMFWLGLSVLAFYFRKTAPWFIFGLLWFFVAHSIESSILPLELMFEHRNYAPSFGLIFAALITVYFLWMKFLANYKHYLFGILSIYLFFLAVNTFFVSGIWGNSPFMYQVFVENNPNSARAHLSWAELNAKWSRINPEKKEYFQQAIKNYTAATHINKNLIAGITHSILLKNDLRMDFNDDIDLLYQRLKSIQANSTFIVNTRAFVSNGISKLPNDLIDNYFKIILNNPKTKGMFKGILYREYADFLYQKNGMSQEVIDHLKKSIEASPNEIKLKIYYTKALIKVKQYQNAGEMLNELYKMDNFGRYTQQLNEIKTIINSYQ